MSEQKTPDEQWERLVWELQMIRAEEEEAPEPDEDLIKEVVADCLGPEALEWWDTVKRLY